MPIKLPLSATIHSSDFREHEFSFPVESILDSYQGEGHLIICASTGYGLTTAPGQAPVSEQRLTYAHQPDGSYRAGDTVTIVVMDESTVDGTVAIRDPMGETVTLTILPAPEMALVGQTPVLLVSTQTLLFDKTASGKPVHRVFTVTQQQADTPVTITTDAPENFQLASDQRPLFGPTLTLTPSASGTYIHVRYLPTRRGTTEAVLRVEAPYASQYLNLTGYKASWLPAKQAPPAVRPPALAHRTGRLSATQWFWLSQLLIGALALGGYQFRCQLMPSLCQETAGPSAAITPDRLVPTPVPPAQVANNEQRISAPDALTAPKAPKKSSSAKEKPDSVSQETNTGKSQRAGSPVTEKADAPTSSSTASATVRLLPARRVSARPPADSQLTGQPRRRSVQLPAGESELEQELNKKLKNQ